ncbi:MAG: beta-galactosidase, partial [Alloprevotella sp.]
MPGFAYNLKVKAPLGTEWQNPTQVALNKERPHAWFFSFANEQEALKVLPEASSFYQSLNGEWSFHWVGNPEERPVDFYKTNYNVSGWDKVQVPMNWNIVGIQKDGTQKYGMPIYSNQRVIFQHEVAVGDWKKGVMREPSKDWLTYKNRNEVGSYRRTFTLPQNWEGREVYLNFDGVDSFFYLYINGKYVGFSKNSRNLASFDISPYLVKGENVLAVEVYRNNDGSFLESQDMFRLPGIFRNVGLVAKPKVQVRDVVAIPDFDASLVNASLDIKASLNNLSTKNLKGLRVRYRLFEKELYGEGTTPVAGVSAETAPVEVRKGNEVTASVKLQAGALVKKWSAEAPWRYVLVGELVDAKDNVLETFSTIVGFRKIEIKQTAAQDDEFGKAGRYYYLNGKPIKMKGVNRHETNPERGHAITREQMEKEVMLMKRGNINHVRNSHYSNDPYWYYLADKYGIYLEDECNIESHEYYYGKESLSHVPEFRDHHVARNLEMVHATVNHPSVCIWSLGNEAGPGDNFVDAYKAIKAFDTSRPVQYERNNDIVDMGSNQYPSIG